MHLRHSRIVIPTKWTGRLAQRAHPAQGDVRIAAGFVFGTQGRVPAHLGNRRKDGRIVQFTPVRRSPVRDRRKLNMPDLWLQSAQPGDHIALSPSHVIAIKHKFQVRRAHIRNDLNGLIRGLQKVPRRIVAVQRLDQNGPLARHLAGISKVRHKRLMRRRTSGKACHYMHRPCIYHSGISQSLIDRSPRLALTSGQSRQPILAPRHITPPRVQAQHRQSRVVQRRAHIRSGHIIRPMTLHRIKTRRLRRTNGIRQRPVRPQEPQICRKTRHVSSPGRVKPALRA
mmetsp:Transcript_23922/g.43493  ORF Transcript_23922/g.43493 Transcript_23922/m.43493 type:complete len:284 (+) Transcript_23922:627-1478(+)